MGVHVSVSGQRLLVRGFWALFAGTVVATSSGCDRGAPPVGGGNAPSHSLWVGSAIAGEGNELAAVDVVVGDKAGPAGVAFASGLANQHQGHPAIVAVLQPNVAVKPSTLLVPRVTITGEKASVQFFDPVRQGVSRAVVDAVAEKVIPADKAEELVIVVVVFVHTGADDKAKLFRNNYDAAKAALKRAMAGEPSVETVEKARRKN